MSDSLIIWIIGGVVALIVLGVSIVDRFSARKLDDSLIKALKSNEKSFLNALKEHTTQAENRALAICALLDVMRERIQDGKDISQKLYEIVISDKDWGVKLNEIDKNTRSIEDNRAILAEIKGYILALKIISEGIQKSNTELHAAAKETSGILRAVYGKREKNGLNTERT